MKTAMILAAGRGERLRPMSDVLPKALCCVKNKPLIEFHIEKLSKAGFERIVINHAHLGGQIRRYLGDGQKWNIEICYAPEPPGGLETGGGIFNALPLLGRHFLAVNADIFTDYDFEALSLEANSFVKLVLVPNPSHNLGGDFGLMNGLLTNDRHYTYPGIAYYRSDVFAHCRPGRYSVTPIIRLLAEKKLATAELYNGLWLDIGTVARLRLANNF
nr:NTP transferase domain-containing protein [Legionella jordanis]